MPSLDVHAHWDEEARVWWADSDDLPGLVTEAPVFSDLVGYVESLAPFLIKGNLGRDPHGFVVRITGGQSEETIEI